MIMASPESFAQRCVGDRQPPDRGEHNEPKLTETWWMEHSECFDRSSHSGFIDSDLFGYSSRPG
jgi:hypothetical protein